MSIKDTKRYQIFEAEKSGADAAYIARLREIQAIEKSASAFDTLTTIPVIAILTKSEKNDT